MDTNHKMSAEEAIYNLVSEVNQEKATEVAMGQSSIIESLRRLEALGERHRETTRILIEKATYLAKLKNWPIPTTREQAMDIAWKFRAEEQNSAPPSLFSK